MLSKLGLGKYFKINHLSIRVALIFIFFFVLFLLIHLLNDGFTSSDDPYYHAKHASLIAQSGDLTLTESWLEFHFFNYTPVDPWWGFHLGMAFFIYFFGLILGVKIFISFLAALVFLVFYLILKNLNIKYPVVWIFLLFFSSTTFDYRLFLERPHILSMIVFPLVIYFLIKNKNFWLFLLVLVYALSYHLAWLIISLVIFYMLVEGYYKKQINLKPLIASSGAILAGIIIHPDSLNYLYFMFINTPKLFFLKFSGVNWQINELHSQGFFEFLESNFLVLCFYILALVLFLSLRKPRAGSAVGFFLFLYSSLWFIVTLLIPRGVEYWLPAVFLFAAFTFNDFLKTEEFKQIKGYLNDKVNIKIIGFFIFSALAIIVFNNSSQVFLSLYYSKTDELGKNYQQANAWLKINTEKDSIIFYDNWGMWPMMFFYNDYNHYVTGIGPTFLYEYDEKMHWLWNNLSYLGLYCDQPKSCLNLNPREQIRLVPLTIKTTFRAKYAVVSNYENNNLIKTLNNLKNQVQLVFKNKDLLIYEMK